MTVVGGVVQPDYASCSDGPVGGFIEVPGPTGPTGPQGPQGPPGNNATSKFPFIFVFGDAIDAPSVGSKIAIPAPSAGSFVSWQARHANGQVATAAFHLRYASTPTGAVATVGGTQPSLTTVVGRRETTVDWTTTAVVAGGVLECEYVSGDTLGVTLMVEFA